IALPAPDRGALERSSWFTPTERPPAQTHPTPPQTVEEARPEIRPFGQGGLASTTQRDGVPMISPPPTAPPPRTMPRPEASRPPVAEPPPLPIPSSLAVPPPHTARPP